MLRTEESPSRFTSALTTYIHAFYAKIPQAIILSGINPNMYLAGVKVGSDTFFLIQNIAILFCVLALVFGRGPKNLFVIGTYIFISYLASITASATFSRSASPDNVACWYIMTLQ